MDTRWVAGQQGVGVSIMQVLFLFLLDFAILVVTEHMQVSSLIPGIGSDPHFVSILSTSVPCTLYPVSLLVPTDLPEASILKMHSRAQVLVL